MNKKILNLAIPNIISNITIPLLGLVDLALVGHLGSEYYIGAVSIGGMLFNFIYWGFGFLRMGTTGLVAQAFGRRRLDETMSLLGRALLVALSGAFLLLILQSAISWVSFAIIEGSSQVEMLAKEYFNIRIWAAPATIGLYALLGWFIGMQNAKYPMIIAVFINVLNIAFNLFFVKVLGMKSDGVALGTVLAQYSGLILGFIFILISYRKLFKYWCFKKVLRLNEFKEFYLVNRDIFIRTICLIFSLSFFTAQSVAKGDLILAVNTLLMQFFIIFAYLADGFAYAGEALVGKFFGSKNMVNLKKVIKYLFYWGGGTALFFTFLYIFFGECLLKILTNEKNILVLAQDYFFWVCLIPLISFAAFIWDGVYIGTTASVGMRNTMLFSTFVVFLPVWYLTKNFMGNHSLWLAFCLLLLSRGLSQAFLSDNYIYKKISQPKK